MASRIRVHYDNPFGFDEPHLWVWSDGSLVRSDVAPTDRDDFGHVYDITVVRQEFHFKFKNGPGTAGPWEPASLDRSFRPLERRDDTLVPDEVWCTGNAFVYHVEPKGTEPESAEAFLGRLPFTPGTYIPETGAVSGLGASRHVDGRTLFGLYHPTAARVYLM